MAHIVLRHKANVLATKDDPMKKTTLFCFAAYFIVILSAAVATSFGGIAAWDAWGRTLMAWIQGSLLIVILLLIAARILTRTTKK